MKDRPVYDLRPHHGMCLAFFVGEGYSDEFTAHMRRSMELLMNKARIRLCTQPDLICEKCPNQEDCAADGKAAEYDRAVLSRCGLTAGEILSFSDFILRVERCILEPGHRASVCGGCRWDSICRSVPDRWKTETGKKPDEDGSSGRCVRADFFSQS